MRVKKLTNVSNENITVDLGSNIKTMLPPGSEITDITVTNCEELKDKADCPPNNRSDKEKVKAFDKLYKNCREHFNSIVNGKDDDPHYLYEDLMNTVLNKGIWETLRKYS